MSNHLDQPSHDAGFDRPLVNGIDCAEALDLIPAMALGAIETGSRIALHLHCDACPSCAAELAASERIVSYLPFSAPALNPPPGAKQALFARINEAIEAPVIAAAAFGSPIVDSPAAKRPSATAPARPGFAINDLASWPKALLAGGAVKFAAAPLALALVLVTVYAFQALETDDATMAILPTAAADSASEQPAAPVVAIDESALQDVTFLSADTRGASITQPLAQTYSSDTAPFVVRSRSAGAPTELLRSVAPKFADCSMVRNASGAYDLVVSGVNLPGSSREAAVYLITQSGERLRVASVVLDERGNGSVTFTIDRPLTDFRTLQVGSIAEEIASAGPTRSGVVSFSLTVSARSAQGLALSS